MSDSAPRTPTFAFLAGRRAKLSAQSLGYRTTLARSRSPGGACPADWCFIDIVNDRGRSFAWRCAHANPSHAALAAALEGFPARPAGGSREPAGPSAARW